MLAQPIQCFVEICFPYLAYVKSLFSLYFSARQTSAVLFLRGNALPVMIEEADFACREVDLNVELCGRQNSFTPVCGEVPRSRLARLRCGCQAFADKEVLIWSVSNTDYRWLTYLDLQQRLANLYNYSVT